MAGPPLAPDLPPPAATGAPRRQVAPNQFTAGNLVNICSVPTDSLFSPTKLGARGVADLAVQQYQPEWWFQYFWKEASQKVGGQSKAVKDQLLHFFNTAFEKPPKFGLDNRYIIPRGRFLEGGRFSADELRGHLKLILEIGFDWITSTGGGATGSAAMLTYAQIADRPVHYRLVWRGESRRTLDQLRQRGYATQAADEQRATQLNMRQAWHPFSVEADRQKIWYRTGQNDNCLYTAVSVATDWRASACFPKIGQTADLSKIKAAADGGTSLSDLRKTYVNRIGEVTYVNGNKELRLVTISKVALMALDGLYLDTHGVQESVAEGTGYPELGAQAIAGSNVLAMVEYVRVHHGLSDADGFTAFAHKSGSRCVSREDLVMSFIDEKARTDYYTEVTRAFQEASRYKPAGLRWAANGYAEIEPLSRVREITLNGQRVYSAA